MVPSYFEPDKTLLQLFRDEKSEPEPDLEIKKCSSQLLGAMEKDYDIYLSQKNWFTASTSTKKNVSQLFASEKKWFIAISRLTNAVAAIQRLKKVDPCIWEIKKCSSQPSNSMDPLFSISKQLQQCLSGSKQLRTIFSQLKIAGKHFYLASTGCEPVFLTLNRCHNLFPCS